MTVYFKIIRKPYTYPLTFKRHGENRADVIRQILTEFPDAKIVN